MCGAIVGNGTPARKHAFAGPAKPGLRCAPDRLGMSTARYDEARAPTGFLVHVAPVAAAAARSSGDGRAQLLGAGRVGGREKPRRVGDLFQPRGGRVLSRVAAPRATGIHRAGEGTRQYG